MNRFQVAAITLLCLPLLAGAQSARADFITLWDTHNPRSSVVMNAAPAPDRDANTIYFPGIGSNYTIRYRAVNEAVWHALNGVSSTPESPLRIELPAAGKYYIAVAPTGFHGFCMGAWDEGLNQFCYHGDAERLIGVVSWGAVQWVDLNFAFANCTHLAQLPLKHDAEFPDAIKAPSLATSSLGWMFYGCAVLTEMGEEGKNWDLAGWDVARVTSLAGAFKGCERLVGYGLRGWDVHSVQNFWSTFEGCTDFQQDLTAAEDISSWKTPSATNMAGIFMGCSNLKADLSRWNVGRVTSFAGTFARCHEFRADLSGWDVSSAVDLAGMFLGCEKFNSNLALWNVEKVRRMDRLFYGCEAFDYPLGSWNPKSLLNAEGMLDGCTFEGWYRDGARYDFSTPVTGSFTLKAVWQKNGQPAPATFTVTFDPANGRATFTQEVVAGNRVARVAAPTKADHSFIGWYRDGATEPYNFDSPVTESFTLTARYRDERIAALNSCLLQGVEVMPNPVNAELHLIHARSLKRYTLFNALGLPVLMGEHDGGETITLQASALPAGIYFIRLEAADGQRTLRVVKQ